MMLRAGRTLSAAAVATALLLGGCSSSDTAARAGEQSSAAGAALSADAVQGKSATYSVTAPTDWSTSNAETKTKVEGLDLLLISSKPVDNFADNLVVIVGDGDDASVRAELEKGRTSLADAGREISDAEDLRIADTSASGFTSTAEQQGIAITARSYGFAHEGKVYLLTLSSSTAHQAEAMKALEQIASSWTWV